MWKRHASKRPTRRQVAAARARAANQCRPHCESLEDRTVPSILFSSTGARTITDSGGPILSRMQVDLIFWGTHWNDPGANQTLRTNVTNIVTAILNSTYFDGLGQYRSIGRGSLLRSDTITSNSPGSTFQTANNGDLATMVANNINNNTLPAPNGQILYFVVPQPGSTPSDCSGCVGRHLAGIASNNRVFPYGLVSNPTNVSLDTLSWIMSHEMAEAATNPEWNITINNVNQAAFHVPGNNGDEIGDGEPNGTYLYRLDGVLVQAYLSQRDHAYIVTNGSTNTFLVSSAFNLSFPDGFGNNLIEIYRAGNGVAAVFNSSTAQFEPGSIHGITVNALNTDSISIDQTGADAPVTVNLGGDSGLSIAVGVHSLADIQGSITVHGATGTGAVVVLDNSAPANLNLTYTVTSSSVTRPGAAAITFTGLTNGSTVYLFGSDGTDVYNVTGTPAGSTTKLTTGHGGNTINVGLAGSVAGIQGGLTINNLNATTGVNIDGHNDRASQNVITLDTVTNGAQFMQLTGLTPAPILSQCSANGDFNLQTSSAGALISALATCGHSVNLHGGGANTSVTIGNRNSSVQGIQGPITVVNAAGLQGVGISDAGDTGNRTVTVNTVTTDTQYTSVTGLAPVPIYIDCAHTNIVSIDTSSGTVATNVLAACTPYLFLTGHSANTTFTVGNAGNLSGIQGTQLDINNVTGHTVIDDSQDAGNRTATVNASNIIFPQMSFTGLAPAPITVRCPANQDVDVSTGTGTVATNVLGTCGHGLTLHGNSAATSVTVGNAANSLDSIQSPVTVNGNVPGATLILNDQGNSTQGMGYQIYSNHLNRATLGGGVQVIYAGISNLVVNAGSGTSDDIAVLDTPATMAVTINAGTGSDTVHAGGSIVGNLGPIQGPLTVNGQGNTSLTLYDQSTTTDQDFLVTDTEVTRTGGFAVNYANIQNLTLDGGSGSNIWSIEATAAGVNTAIYSGAGYNQFGAGDGDRSDLFGPLAIQGQPGSDSFLEYWDYLNPTAQTYTLTATTISQAGRAPVSYTGLAETILIPANVGGNTIDVQGVAAGGPTDLDAATGDLVTIGTNQSLASVQGSVIVNNAASVVIDDSADTTPPAGPITLSNDVTYGFSISGLTPQIIYLDASAVTAAASLRLGAGNKDVQLQAVPQNVALTLDAGSGTNTLDYSNYAGNVSANFQTGEFTGFSGIANIQNVIGGQGSNILVGDGNENLTGGPGQNLIISGGGSGQLTGGGAGDILIGGTTAYDTDDASLQAILSYWTTSGDDYPTRVANLRAGNGVPQLEGGITVFDNGAANTITGNGSEDQGIFNLFYVTEAGTVTDQQPDEVVVDIDNPAGMPQSADHGDSRSLSRESLTAAVATDYYFLQHRNEMNGMNLLAEPAHGGQTAAMARVHPIVRPAEGTAAAFDLFAPW